MKRTMTQRILSPLAGVILDVFERRRARAARRSNGHSIRFLANYLSDFNAKKIYNIEENNARFEL